MTVTAIPPAHCRANRPATHAYRMPVVRELPPHPIEICDSRTW